MALVQIRERQRRLRRSNSVMHSSRPKMNRRPIWNPRRMFPFPRTGAWNCIWYGYSKLSILKFDTSSGKYPGYPPVPHYSRGDRTNFQPDPANSPSLLHPPRSISKSCLYSSFVSNDSQFVSSHHPSRASTPRERWVSVSSALERIALRRNKKEWIRTSWSKRGSMSELFGRVWWFE